MTKPSKLLAVSIAVLVLTMFVFGLASAQTPTPSATATQVATATQGASPSGTPNNLQPFQAVTGTVITTTLTITAVVGPSGTVLLTPSVFTATAPGMTAVVRLSATAAITPSTPITPSGTVSTSVPSARVTGTPLNPAGPAATTATASSSSQACLACHGPYDKIMAATASYVLPSGDKVSPHQFVPHDSTNVPDCTNCHKPHPIPPTASDIAAMQNTSPKYCTECHHTGNMESCAICHEIPSECRTGKPCGP